ncbi:MAG TPA: nitrogenase component 1 [Chitinispirillaceae bacterium]|nr:nitrogenase component 1 [Chitinispirillaceae bacterium]
MKTAEKKSSYATVNPCRLCAPLGASIAIKGIEKAMPLIHGSQGCATYIRRYLISHYREPVDIASSSFSEETAIFGGGENLNRAIKNVIGKYSPSVIGITTTCLSETIGDDTGLWLHQYKKLNESDDGSLILKVNTPSYNGAHGDGFHAAIAAIAKTFAGIEESGTELLIIPPMVSPADLRILSGICKDFGINTQLLPDYSETLDGGTWEEYLPLPKGGTPISSIKSIGTTKNVIELGVGSAFREAGEYISSTFSCNTRRMKLPVGVRANDQFLAFLSEISGKEIPDHFQQSRARLLDAYVDAHKYVFEKKAAIIGDEDTVAAIVTLCSETGIIPSVCATASGASRLKQHVIECVPDIYHDQLTILDEADFDTVEALCLERDIDICIGTSKGYGMSKKMSIPLVRIGFPVHDRFGAARIVMTGYDGTIRLFDEIVNALLSSKQESNVIGYSYL